MLSWFREKLFGWYDTEMGVGWNASNIWGKITHPFTRTWHWFVKSAEYSIFLWSDFDWDYIFILKHMRYKIRRTRERIVKNDLVVSAPKQAAEMMHVEKLITKYLENDFCKEEFAAHDKKWGETKMTTSPSELGEGFRQLNFSRPNANTEEEIKQQESEYLALLNKQERERQDCWNSIFDCMKEYMQGWWD